MKNKIFKSLILAIIFIIIFITKVEATPANTAFEDDEFYKSIIDILNNSNINGVNDRAYDYIATDEELEMIKEFEMGLDSNSYRFLRSLKGIEKLKGLESIYILGTSTEVVDLSENKALIDVTMAQGNLKKIILPENSKIRALSLNNNKIEKIEDIVNLETSNNLSVLKLFDNYIQDISQVEDNNKIAIKMISPQNEIPTIQENPYEKDSMFLDVTDGLIHLATMLLIIYYSYKTITIVKNQREKNKKIYNNDDDLSGRDDNKYL